MVCALHNRVSPGRSSPVWEKAQGHCCLCLGIMFLRKRGWLGHTAKTQFRRHQFQAPKSEQVVNSSLTLC